MKAIKIMNEEHRYILRMLDVVRSVCFKVLQGEDINFKDFENIIDFIRKYADKHHHMKEEDYLFNRMMEHMSTIAEKVVKNGMLVEHDYGRLYVKNLEEALAKVEAGDCEAKLDVIANAVSYTNLLKRHIEKEDKVIYKFAERELNEEIQIQIDNECEEFEQNNKETTDKYIKLLEDLEKKYIAK